jgi:proline iminopeptidase
MTLQSLQTCKDPRSLLKKLNTPVLVIKAQYDNQKWGFTQEYLTLFKNSQLKVIPNAGHFIEFEQAPELYRTAQTFLAGF